MTITATPLGGGFTEGAAGVTIEDGGTQEGTEITTLDFGDNLSVTVTGTEATITGVGLNAEQRHEIDQVPGLVDKTEDLEILSTSRTWADAVAADASFAVNVARPTNAELESDTYGTSHTYTNLNAASGYVVIRIALAADIRDYRLHKTESDATERFYSGSHFPSPALRHHLPLPRL